MLYNSDAIDRWGYALDTTSHGDTDDIDQFPEIDPASRLGIYFPLIDVMSLQVTPEIFNSLEDSDDITGDLDDIYEGFRYGNVFQHELGHSRISKDSFVWDRLFARNAMSSRDFLSVIKAYSGSTGIDEISSTNYSSALARIRARDIIQLLGQEAWKPLQESYALIWEAYQNQTRYDGNTVEYLRHINDELIPDTLRERFFNYEVEFDFYESDYLIAKVLAGRSDYSYKDIEKTLWVYKYHAVEAAIEVFEKFGSSKEDEAMEAISTTGRIGSTATDDLSDWRQYSPLKFLYLLQRIADNAGDIPVANGISNVSAVESVSNIARTYGIRVLSNRSVDAELESVIQGIASQSIMADAGKIDESENYIRTAIEHSRSRTGPVEIRIVDPVNQESRNFSQWGDSDPAVSLNPELTEARWLLMNAISDERPVVVPPEANIDGVLASEVIDSSNLELLYTQLVQSGEDDTIRENSWEMIESTLDQTEETEEPEIQDGDIERHLN